jgi:hypothetical protein
MKFCTHPPLPLQIAALELLCTLRKSRSVAALPAVAPGLNTFVTGEQATVDEASVATVTPVASRVPAEIGTTYRVGFPPVLPQT